MWRGRTVPVKTEQVRVTLLALQEMEKQLEESSSGDNKVSYYESLLKDLIEAQQALREDLKDDQVKSYWFIILVHTVRLSRDSKY